MLKRTILPLALAMVLTAGSAIGSDRHVNATLEPVNGSGVSGIVKLTSLPQGGTLITVVATGLQPGTEYLSLYYENATCELEPYDEDDVIGRYTADPAGKATVTHKLEDDLDEIHSVSVRLGSDFSLVSCAVVNQ